MSSRFIEGLEGRQFFSVGPGGPGPGPAGPPTDGPGTRDRVQLRDGSCQLDQPCGTPDQLRDQLRQQLKDGSCQA